MKMDGCPIICLANSYKHGGRCVAGLRLDGKGWVRPVSDTADGTLNSRDYRLSDGSDVKILDLVSIPLTEQRPAKHQPENWRFLKKPWELVARPASVDMMKVVANALDADNFLFLDGRNHIPFQELDKKPATSSLAIICPSKLRLISKKTSTGSNQIRAEFRVGSNSFNLAVTDPILKEKMNKFGYGTYDPNEVGLSDSLPVYLTISLGEPLEGQCYKLVAAVLQFELPVEETKEIKETEKTKGKSYSVEEKRKVHPNAYTPWSAEDDQKLRECFQQGMSRDELARLFHRNLGAIRSRLKKLGLAD